MRSLTRPPRVVVVGSGISGLSAAWWLRDVSSLTILEANEHLGGHTHTHDIEIAGRPIAVDTGFIVFNDRTYPLFARLLDELGVQSRGSAMSFSVRNDALDLEYNGNGPRELFAQRRNLVRPGFWRMLRDIARLGREAKRALAEGPIDPSLTLREFLSRGVYSREMAEWYLTPMTGAVWSATPAAAGEIPFVFFARFFENHAFFDLGSRPVWRTVVGGSREYIRAMVPKLQATIRAGCAVRGIARTSDGVRVRTAEGVEEFDAAVISTHGDTALSLLEDPTPIEREVLGAMPYQSNEAVLHTDASVMPRRRAVWASWNALVDGRAGPVGVTYNMNRLQGLETPPDQPVLVTLNRTDRIDPARIIRRLRYEHPVFTAETLGAQKRWADVSRGRTFFAGAAWRYGFHEDGCMSGLRAADAVRASLGMPPLARPTHATMAW